MRAVVVTRDGPRLDDERLRPVVDRVYPFAEVTEAYRQMERGGNWGKLVLEMAE